MPTGPPCIAVVDDDPDLRESIIGLLASAGHKAIGYSCAEAFLQSACAPACVILDANLPGMSGLELLERLRANVDPVPAVMISARGYDEFLVARALQGGAAACLRKPFAGEELLSAVRNAIGRGNPKVQ